MKRLLLIFIFLIPTLVCSAKKSATDSLLKELDKTILKGYRYDSEKQARIARLQKQLSRTFEDNLRFEITHSIFDEYNSFKMDSALFYARERLKIAQRMSSTQYVTAARMNIVDALKGMGEYNEALEILGDITRNSRITDSLYYSYLYHSIYNSLYRSAPSLEEREKYRILVVKYKKQLLRFNQPNTLGYVINEMGLLQMTGEPEKALALGIDFYKRTRFDISKEAVFAFCMAELYGELGDKGNEMYYLALASLYDLHNASKKYMALQQLAVLLYENGDVTRAYRYIMRSMEDIAFCNARCRMFEIAEFLPIIAGTHDFETKQEAFRKSLLIVLISVLTIVLVAVLILLRMRNLRISAAHRELDEKNEELKVFNENLNVLNSQLVESNKIKEEYIGQLFNLCSAYIDKQQSYRKMLERKIKAGQISEIPKILSDSSIATKELKDFFKSFDVIFLSLFPNYIESFNALLLKGEEIKPKDGELLTPELRIYALVRLGVTDSTKIADFLHYSLQTVYNYRMKIRSKAAVPKGEFVEYVQRLC